MTKRARDFKAEYARRIAGVPKGSRKAARGHKFTERPLIRQLAPTKRHPGRANQFEVSRRPQDLHLRSTDVKRAFNKTVEVYNLKDNAKMRISICGKAVFDDAQVAKRTKYKKGKRRDEDEEEFDEELAAEGLVELDNCMSSLAIPQEDLEAVIDELGTGFYFDDLTFANIYLPIPEGAEWVEVNFIDFAPGKMLRDLSGFA